MADGNGNGNNGNDWFHLNAISNFIKNVGFPVAMCMALTYMVYQGQKSLDKIAGEMDSFHIEHETIMRADYDLAGAVRDELNYIRGKEGQPQLPPPVQSNQSQGERDMDPGGSNH